MGGCGPYARAEGVPLVRGCVLKATKRPMCCDSEKTALAAYLRPMCCDSEKTALAAYFCSFECAYDSSTLIRENTSELSSTGSNHNLCRLHVLEDNWSESTARETIGTTLEDFELPVLASRVRRARMGAFSRRTHFVSILVNTTTLWHTKISLLRWKLPSRLAYNATI